VDVICILVGHLTLFQSFWPVIECSGFLWFLVRSALLVTHLVVIKSDLFSFIFKMTYQEVFIILYQTFLCYNVFFKDYIDVVICLLNKLDGIESACFEVV
jgi:hypothetical protein